MSLIRKPSEIEAKQTISMLIYGQPGIGKTTLAMSMPNPILIDADGGVSRTNPEFRVDTVQVQKWEDILEALKEIREAGCYKTIIIDTLGKTLDYSSEFIMRTNSKMRKNDGTLSLQGYGLRNVMFHDLLVQAFSICPYVVFLAHEREEKQGDLTVKRAEIGSARNANDLYKELDTVLYMQAIGRDRTIWFDPSEEFYAKNTFGLNPSYKVTTLTDAKGVKIADNNFLSRLILSAQQKSREANEAIKNRYKELVSRLSAEVDSIASAEDANKFVESMGSVAHVYDSRILIGNAFKAKVSEIGLVFNPNTKKYESPAA